LSKKRATSTRIRAHFAGNHNGALSRCGARVVDRPRLTTLFVDGTKITDFPRLAELGVDRPALAELVLRSYCQMVLVDGVYHADPHPQHSVGGDGSITFIDFGAVGRMAPAMKAGVPCFGTASSPRRDAYRVRASANGE